MSEGLKFPVAPPKFSISNPYWPKPVVIGELAVGRPTLRDYLAASHWEAKALEQFKDFEDGGGHLALKVAFFRGAVWRVVWKNQLRQWFRVGGARRLLKEMRKRGQAGIFEADASGSGLRAPGETSAGPLSDVPALHC